MRRSVNHFKAVLVLLLTVCAVGALLAQGGYSYQEGLRYQVSAQTVLTNGGGTPASGTLTVQRAYATIDCQDPDGCNLTINETGAQDGYQLVVVNISTNTVNFADTGGVTEIAGAFAAGQYDSIRYIYVTNRWVEVSRSNN